MAELTRVAFGNNIVTMTREEAQLPSLAEVLTEKRSKVFMSRMKFALISHQQGWITEAEALAWAGGTTIPSWVETIIDTNVPVEDRLKIKISVLTDTNIKRTGTLMPMLQAEKEVSDTELDSLFGINVVNPESPLTP